MVDLPRMRVAAFVLDDGTVRWENYLGTVTLGDILTTRPDKGRYVIGEVVGVTTNPWWVVDLYTVPVNPHRFNYSDSEIGYYDTYGSLDVALAATVSLIAAGGTGK